MSDMKFSEEQFLNTFKSMPLKVKAAFCDSTSTPLPHNNNNLNNLKYPLWQCLRNAIFVDKRCEPLKSMKCIFA